MKDAQRKSTAARSVEQLPLLPIPGWREPTPAVPDLDHLRTLKSLRAAIAYSLHLADIDAVDAYRLLKKDKSTWSRIMSGDMSFPADDLPAFCKRVRNDAALLWLTHQCGFDIEHMVRIKSSLEQENERLREENARLRREREIERNYARELLGRGAA